MRVAVFFGWGWVALCILATIGCAAGSIWADGDKVLAENLSETGWLFALVSVLSGVVTGVATGVLHDEGKL